MIVLYCIAILSIFTSPVWTYGEGAPNDQETCKNLMPGHFAPPQTSSPPYTINLSSNTVKPKETITVTLKGNTEDDLFKGFMIQARQNDHPIGRFDAGVSKDYFQLRTCRAESDTASHRKIKGRGINDVSFKWTAPEDVKGSVSFVGTLVKDRPTFWVAKTYAQIEIV